MNRATKLTGRAKPSCGTPILRFVREVLRQRDLLLLATEYDDLAGILLAQDKEGDRRRQTGEPRIWTKRDRRERYEEYLLQEWHNTDMTLQEFAERARGTHLDTSAVMEGEPLTGRTGRPWKDPRSEVRAFHPRTHRLWQRFRKRAGIPSYLPEFQAAMAEAQAGPAFSMVAPILQALASAHDAYLRCVGNRVTDSGDDIEEQDPADRDWREILNAYDAAIRDLLPFLPPSSVQHDGWAHDKNDPVYMAADLVLQPQDAGLELAGPAADALQAAVAAAAYAKQHSIERQVEEAGRVTNTYGPSAFNRFLVRTFQDQSAGGAVDASQPPDAAPAEGTQHKPTDDDGRQTGSAGALQDRKAAGDLVFISYSHKDNRKWLDDLKTHLAPLVREGLISPWSDQKIREGSKWLADIETAIARTRVAVLLVTPNFLASDFIHEHELCPLLKSAEDAGVQILWIPVCASSYKRSRLKDIQALIPPDKPLEKMKAERNEAWVSICEKIAAAASC